MVNTDFRMRSMFASLEKEANGEKFRKALINALKNIEQSHAQNVKKQKEIDLTWEVDYDPDPFPDIIPRVLAKVPPDDLWGTYYQIDVNGNITMEQTGNRTT